MNKYLRKWIDETYPLMGNDIEELDQYDINKFANWLEKQLSISRVLGRSEQLVAFCEWLSERDFTCDMTNPEDWVHIYLKSK